jgi:hypothetical protein
MSTYFPVTPCQFLPGLFDFPVKTKISLSSCFSNSWSGGDMALKRRRKVLAIYAGMGKN